MRQRYDREFFPIGCESYNLSISLFLMGLLSPSRTRYPSPFFLTRGVFVSSRVSSSADSESFCK